MGLKHGFDASTFREERMLRRSRQRLEAVQIEKAFERYNKTYCLQNKDLSLELIFCGKVPLLPFLDFNLIDHSIITLSQSRINVCFISIRLMQTFSRASERHERLKLKIEKEDKKSAHPSPGFDKSCKGGWK